MNQNIEVMGLQELTQLMGTIEKFTGHKVEGIKDDLIPFPK